MRKRRGLPSWGRQILLGRCYLATNEALLPNPFASSIQHAAPNPWYCSREAEREASSDFGDSGPARSWIFAAGAAGRRGERRGAWCSTVHSRASYGVSLEELGVMPVTGDMPMGCVLRARASSVCWLLVVLLLMVVAWCWLPKDGFSPALPQ